jgi:exonuclease SbcC
VTVRPVRLDLSGFAAFRDPTVVDFTDADYFALTGPTGSGKSTVIDGLTFALYGSAPRWGRENAIQYALAPTANRCTVRLVFDVAGQRYVVAREVRRIGKQIAQRNTRLERYACPAATGDPETDEPTESLAADPKAVRQQVTELLGLEFEDFCTCVVLPQGDFATFLQASVGQRQDILLKLLGARHYDAIGRLAGRRANDARARVDALAGELSGYADATEEAEAAARGRESELVTLLAAVTDQAAAVTGLAAERVRAATAAARATEELGRFQTVAVPGDIDRLQQALAAAEAGYREANAAEQLAAGAAVAAEDALRSGPPHGWLEETLRWHTELADAADRIPAATQATEAGRTGLERATRDATGARATLETVRAEHDRHRAEHERADLAVTELTGRIEVLRSVALPVGAGEMDAAVVAARGRWQSARRALDAAEAAVTRARSAVAELPERSAINARLRALEAYEATLGELAGLRGRLHSVGERHRAAEAALAEARTAQRRATDALENVRSQSVAADLRPHLQVGHACPVCTQTVVELPDPLAVPALADARAALQDAEQLLTTAEATALGLRTERTALDTQVTGAVERLSGLDDALLADLPEQPAGDARDPGRDRSVLTDLGERLEAAVDQERAATAAREAALAALQDAEDEGQRLATAAQQGWADLHATSGRLAALGAPPVTAETLGAAWSELLAWADHRITTLVSTDLPAARSALDTARTTRQTSAEALGTAVAAEHAAREALTAATLADDKARSELAVLTSRVAERQGLLADRPGADEAQRLLAEHRRLDEQATLARSRAQQAAVARQQAETVRDRWRTEQQAARTTLVQMRDGFAGLGVPALDTDDLPRAWAALAAWAGEQADRRTADLIDLAAGLERLDGNLAERFDRVRALLDEHAIERPTDAVPTDPAAPTATAQLARIPILVELQLERGRAATAAIVRQRSAADRLRTKIAADTETEQVSRQLQQLMSAKRFPQWLADAALDTLVTDASASLLQLSGGQFELTHDRGEFFVIDHADADSRRSVKTLSGGETFQASLALALALSEQLATLAAGGRTTLDSIFLDEGFGTLDPDALEIVAGTLENLAQGNRMVGVVTHVTALAERVPIRYEVSRDSRTSTIERVGP